MSAKKSTKKTAPKTPPVPQASFLLGAPPKQVVNIHTLNVQTLNIQ